MDTETTQMGKGKRAGRAAARRAGLLAAEQLESSPVRSADEAGLPSFGEPSRRKAQVKVTYAGKKAQRTNAKRVRSLSPLTSVDSDSELEDGTTLPPRFRSPPLVPQSAPPKPRNNRVAQPIARSLPLFARKRAQTVPSLLKSSRSRSLSSLSSLSDTTVDHPGWGIEDHKLVFVRVDGHGNVSGSDEAMWWPAEVNNVDAPMRVTLFGEYPGSSAKARQRELVVERSSSVVLPFCSGPRKLRFDVRTYSTSSHVTDSLQASPRKRQKTSKAELDTRWCDARDLMLKKYQDMNDGLPLTLSLHVRNDSPDVSPQQSSARQPSISLSNDHDNVDHDIWEPDEIPYDIPGELVLAREKRTFTQYWPAKLMDYIPPQKRGEKAHYMVLFYDGKLKKLPDDSDMFYNESHPNFKSCLLGEDENNYGLNVGERDEDHDLNGHRMVPNEDLTIESLRSSSSEPQGPAPLAFASELSVQEQFEYVKPVLSAILTGQYEPARQKHIGFMKGGKQRNAVIEAAWKRGEVTSGEKEELSTCIVRWMRRRQNRQDMGFLPADPFVAIAPSAGPCDVVGETEIPVSNDNDDESDESVLTELTEHRSTMAGTERAPSSEAEIPPSSFVSTDDTEEDAQIYCGTDATSTGVNNGVPGRTDQTENSASIAVADDLSRNTLPVDTLPLRPSTPAREQLTLPPSGTVPTFAHLSDLDQFTYCTSVLLPEAILQILLWRNGERKSYTLLPPSEEDRLHRIAERYASTTYWVHDIVKLKHLAEGKLLPSITPSYRADVESTPGNARLRPRRK